LFIDSIDILVIFHIKANVAPAIAKKNTAYMKTVKSFI